LAIKSPKLVISNPELAIFVKSKPIGALGVKVKAVPATVIIELKVFTVFTKISCPQTYFSKSISQLISLS